MTSLTISGSGPPALLVPGLDGTGLLFYQQVPRLAARYRVGTLRLPDEARTMEALVAHVHEAVRSLAPGGERVTVIGESFGGALSLSYALAHPESVARLVVLNSFAYFGPQARLWLGYHLLKATPWGMMRLMRQLTAWRMHSPQTGKAELRRFHELMRATTREGYLARLAILRTYDVRDQLPLLTAPTLYLASDLDNLVPSVQQARLMAHSTPGATLRILHGHGHICLIAPDLDLLPILEGWTTTP